MKRRVRLANVPSRCGVQFCAGPSMVSQQPQVLPLSVQPCPSGCSSDSVCKGVRLLAPGACVLGWLVVGTDVPHCYGTRYSGLLSFLLVGLLSSSDSGFGLSLLLDSGPCRPLISCSELAKIGQTQYIEAVRVDSVVSVVFKPRPGTQLVVSVAWPGNVRLRASRRRALPAHLRRSLCEVARQFLATQDARQADKTVSYQVLSCQTVSY